MSRGCRGDKDVLRTDGTIGHPHQEAFLSSVPQTSTTRLVHHLSTTRIGKASIGGPAGPPRRTSLHGIKTQLWPE